MWFSTCVDVLMSRCLDMEVQRGPGGPGGGRGNGGMYICIYYLHIYTSIIYIR